MGIISNKSISSQLSFKALTSPAEQPVSLDEQKIFSRIDGTAEDALIQVLIEAATKRSEDYVRGGFITRQYEQIEDAGYNQNYQDYQGGFFLSEELALEIKNIKTTTIDEFIIYDDDDNPTIVSNALYRLDRPDDVQPSRIVFDSSTSIFTGNSVLSNTRYFTQYKLKYTAGYLNAAAVPSDIKLAIMITAQGYYENRETMQNLAPSSKAILQQYRIQELG